MMFHVVYLSFEDNKIGRDYIGKHSSENPYDEYFGSFADKTFNPTDKIILEYAKSEEGAIKAEIRWQKAFQVVEDPHFANQSYQTSTGFRPRPWDEKTRKKVSEALLGAKNPMFGKTGEQNPFFGRKHTPKNRELLCELNQRKAKDPEWLAKVSKKGKKEKESTRQKKREVNRGFWWIHLDGSTCRSTAHPGAGWERGRKRKEK
jgi:hypothetical protein